jgi:hypothetical protein
MGLTGTGTECEHRIIHLMADIPSMEGPFAARCLGQAVADFHGVGAVAESLVAGEGFVDGSSGKECVAWGPSMKLGGSADGKKVNRISSVFDQ